MTVIGQVFRHYRAATCGESFSIGAESTHTPGGKYLHNTYQRSAPGEFVTGAACIGEFKIGLAQVYASGAIATKKPATIGAG